MRQATTVPPEPRLVQVGGNSGEWVPLGCWQMLTLSGLSNDISFFTQSARLDLTVQVALARAVIARAAAPAAPRRPHARATLAIRALDQAPLSFAPVRPRGCDGEDARLSANWLHFLQTRL